jgi:hypothetical protein
VAAPLVPSVPAVGLFGRRRLAPPAPLVVDALPTTPTQRVLALKAALLERGLGGAAAQGRPLPDGEAFDELVALVEHHVPDSAERRALCAQLAGDLQSMIVVDAVDVDEVLDVLGATPERLSEHDVPLRARAATRGRADAALALARETRLGEGELLDRWAHDDAFVLDSLVVLLVAFTRLAV